VLTWRPPEAVAERISVRSWLAFALYAFLFMAVTFGYQAARWMVSTEDPTIPLQNAERVMEVERALGMFVEPQIQEATQSLGLEPFTTWLYTAAHQPGFVGFFVLLWFLWPSRFLFVLLWFFVTSFISVIGYAAFALAPPRLVPELGLDDPTHETLQLGGTTTWFIESNFRNEYAAMPSLHVGYPFLFAIVIFFALRGTWMRWLAWLWPAAMLWAVMASANHYWLDAVGGAVVVSVSALAVALVLPRLPAPWDRGGAPPAEPPGGWSPTRPWTGLRSSG
jgi:membrane-associated phospholipid phosphatase